MQKKIKFGIIGCSQIAQNSTLPAILKSKNSQIEMIGSRIQNKAKRFAEKFHCTNFGIYEEVLENKNIDAVYISVPVGLHKKWCVKAAKAGKHILCEKSSSSSFSDSEKMVDEAKKNKIRIMEGFMFRFHPSHKQVKRIVNSGKLGEIYSFFSRYGFQNPPRDNIRFKKDLGGGILNDAGCYPICASRMIFEKEPIGVMCQSIVDNNDVDIKTTINLKFNNSQFAQIVTGYGLSYQSLYSLWGTRGFLQLSRSYNIPIDMKPLISLNFGEKEKKISIQPADHFKLMVEAFSEEIKRKRSCDFNFEDELLRQAKVMDACRISSLKNKFVEINW